jgi:regulator of sigma E protease
MVGGPLAVMEIASKAADEGLEVFVQRLAVLSINLGLMNLLPIPVLDGFHLVSAGWEAIRRRPIPVRAREIANLVGLGLLALLMVLVLKNDISRFLR